MTGPARFFDQPEIFGKLGQHPVLRSAFVGAATYSPAMAHGPLSLALT